MTTTSTFVGFSEGQKISSRVLKPPGGGSSIMFGDDDDLAKKSSKASTPAPNATPAPEATKENVPSTTESSSPVTDSTHTPQKSPTTNGMNGDVKSDSSPSTTISCTTSSSPATPSSLKDPDTKTRLFGDDTTNLPPRETPTPRRVKDRMKSSIFSADESASPSAVPNGTASPALNRGWGGGGGRRRVPHTVRNPITGEGVFCWDLHPPRSLHVRRKGNPGCVSKQSSTESSSANEKPIEAPQPRGRVPPGGFSTKLW